MRTRRRISGRSPKASLLSFHHFFLFLLILIVHTTEYLILINNATMRRSTVYIYIPNPVRKKKKKKTLHSYSVLTTYYLPLQTPRPSHHKTSPSECPSPTAHAADASSTLSSPHYSTTTHTALATLPFKHKPKPKPKLQQDKSNVMAEQTHIKPLGMMLLNLTLLRNNRHKPPRLLEGFKLVRSLDTHARRDQGPFPSFRDCGGRGAGRGRLVWVWGFEEGGEGG